MKRSKFSETQIVAVLKEGEKGAVGGRYLPRAWDQHRDVFSVEEQVRGDRRIGSSFSKYRLSDFRNSVALLFQVLKSPTRF